MQDRRITSFDTTFRRGEHSPGIVLRPEQTAGLAEQREQLGIDVIEGGFDVASSGDFEGVCAVAALAERRHGDVPLSPVFPQEVSAR